jgi:lysophospholipase L1-like esterase
MMHLDPVLGWRTQPAAYVYPGYVRGAPDIRMTIWPDGSRATAPAAAPGPARVLLVGDSLTHGWAVSDDETFAWKLQARWPEVGFRNYGAGGYGTYQTLLLLEEILARPGPGPRLVVYDLIDDHERRNVADFHWLKVMSDFRSRGTAAVPSALLRQDGTLERHPPETFAEWPLRGRLATVAALEDAYMWARTRNRQAQQRAVTEVLLRELDALASRHGARLLVVLLTNVPEGRAHYGRFLADAGIRFVDCGRPSGLHMMVPGEGHPNGEMHSIWADCIAAAIGEHLE